MSKRAVVELAGGESTGGLAAFARGRLDLALAAFDTEAATPWEHAVHAHALTLVGRFQAAEDAFRAAAALPLLRGDEAQMLWSWHALHHTLQGRYGEAQDALEVARLHRSPSGATPFASVCAAALGRAFGSGEMTRDHALAALDAFDADADPYWLVRAHRLAGDGIDAVGGDPEPSWRRAVELADRTGHPVAQTIAYLGRARSAGLGIVERRGYAVAAVAAARRCGYRLGLIDAVEAAEMLSVDRLASSDADRVVAAASAERRRLGYRVRRDPFATPTPTDELDVVAGFFEQAGPSSWSTATPSQSPAVRHEGVANVAPQHDGWSRLTPAERRVVDLVADGLSNPQIGERLYVSRRTVQSQVSSAFLKVGVDSRSALAAAVVRRRHLVDR